MFSPEMISNYIALRCGNALQQHGSKTESSFSPAPKPITFNARFVRKRIPKENYEELAQTVHIGWL